jgi:hypothetical protein
VVGHRVVVRRLLPGETGPSGGPAMTDVLGTCLRWSDGECVVQPESGPAVTIPLSLIVSGKPVPPRPSSRFRVDPRECQLRAMALWPDIVTEPLGNWLLRDSATSTARRANSVMAFGPAGVPDAYEQVVAHYARPVANVLPDSAEDELFRGHGWVTEGHEADTVFMLASTARVARGLPADLPAAAVEPAGPGVVRAVVGDVAVGYAAYADDWVGFRGIEVDPAHRGRGLALAVMAALVEPMGFAPHHSYRYLTPG